jgi:4-amino-4-deoxy-L-arabinose transferase-like glycosyltransferase
VAKRHDAGCWSLGSLAADEHTLASVLGLKPLGWVFVLALLARVGAQVALGAYLHPETWEYETIANNLLAGRGYTYASGGIIYVAAVSSPLYVLLTAGVYWLTGHSQAVMLVLQAIFGSATAVLSAWLAGRVFRPQAAWTAGGLVALDPGLAVYAAKLHPLSLDALAFMAVVCTCIWLPVRATWRQVGLLGALLGLAALTRTTILSFLPVLVVWLHRCKGIPPGSRQVLALVAATVVLYGAWPIRNSILLGQFSPGSSESTEWLWRGTNPLATGSSFTPSGQTMLEAAPDAFRARVQAASEAERIDIYRAAAVDYARAHPAAVLALYITKLKAFWWGSDSTGDLYPPAWTVVYDAWYAAMLLLAAAGLWWSWRQRELRPVVILIVTSLVLVAASQAVFYVEGRHRLAVEPLLLVLSGVGLSWLASAAQAARSRAHAVTLTGSAPVSSSKAR